MEERIVEILNSVADHARPGKYSLTVYQIAIESQRFEPDFVKMDRPVGCREACTYYLHGKPTLRSGSRQVRLARSRCCFSIQLTHNRLYINTKINPLSPRRPPPDTQPRCTDFAQKLTVHLIDEHDIATIHRHLRGSRIVVLIHLGVVPAVLSEDLHRHGIGGPHVFGELVTAEQVDQRERIAKLLDHVVVGVLPVASSRPCVMAMAAIIGSQRPIGRPTRSSSQAICPAKSAAAWSNDRICSDATALRNAWMRLEPPTR